MVKKIYGNLEKFHVRQYEKCRTARNSRFFGGKLHGLEPAFLEGSFMASTLHLTNKQEF